MASVARSSGSHDHHQFEGDEFAMANMVDIEGNGGGSDGFDITAGQKMASAMSGSLLVSLLATPLDVVRVRLQSQKPPRPAVDFSKLAHTTTSLTPSQTAELGVTACCREVFFAGGTADYCLAAPRLEGVTVNATAAPECAVEEVQKRTFTSTYDAMRKIARNEGYTTLWRGLSPTLVMNIPANIIYFTGYDWLRYNHASPLSRLSDASAPLISGSAARILAATAVGPIELVRTRMQAAHGTGTTNHLVEAFQGVQDMVRTQGYTSLWRGLVLTLWRDVPFSGLYWWGYEIIRSKITDVREQRRGRSPTVSDSRSRSQARRRSQSHENHTETFVDSFTAGCSSGALASFITTPFDVGKTRTQIYREAPSGNGAKVKAPEERPMVRLLWHIFKTEGVAGLWKGWIPRTLKVAPACAIMISSYEVGKRVFRGINERKLRKQEAI